MFEEQNATEIEYKGKQVSAFYRYDKKGKYRLKFTFVSTNSQHEQSIILHLYDFKGKIFWNGKRLKKERRSFPQIIFEETWAPKEFELEIILEEGDIINVDCTTILDGYYADASRMFIIGKTTPKKEKLVQVARECLEIGMEAAKPFGFIGDIGHAIEKHAKKNGFSVVRDLCGHGVGVEFHEEPDVEHFGKKGTGMLLVPGMVFTIEPMINAGTWEVFIDEEDGWTVVTEDELPSAQWEHTFLMTENGLEILTH